MEILRPLLGPQVQLTNSNGNTQTPFLSSPLDPPPRACDNARMLLLLSILLACGPRPPPASSGEVLGAANCDPNAWPDAAREPMLAARELGLRLAARDRYGWEATDRVAEALKATPAEAAKALAVTGYVIEENDTGAVVHFTHVEGGQVTPVFDVSFDATHLEGTATRIENPTPAGLDTFVARASLAVRSATTDARFVPKANAYNPDVLPWSGDPAEGWAVYLIPGAASFDAVPLGGGYRAHVSADGATVLDMEPLSAGVLSVPVSQLQAQAGGLYMTSVLTPLPDATYIAFSNIWKVPLGVVVADGAWLMSGAGLCFAPMEKRGGE